MIRGVNLGYKALEEEKSGAGKVTGEVSGSNSVDEDFSKRAKISWVCKKR